MLIDFLNHDANFSFRTAVFIVTISDHRFVYVNDICAEFFGRSPSEMEGKTSGELNVWADAGNHRDIVEHISQAGSLIGFEARLKSGNGKVSSQAVSAMLVGVEPARQFIFGFFAPTVQTIRQHFHSDLQRFKAAISGMGESVLIVDSAGKPVDFNPAFMKIHGCETEADCHALLANYFDLYEAYDENGKLIPASNWPIVRVMRGESRLNWECSLVRKSTQEQQFLRFNYGPLLDTDGRLAGAVISAIDISDSKVVKERLSSLEHALQTTLTAVSRMAELRDPYTAGHQRRVGIIASDIAKKMGFSPKRCQDLQWVGLVHDVGKIGVPAEILSKPNQLTPIEYTLVQTHVEKGYEIMQDVNFPLPVAEIIRQHHERIDGTGYPRGLKGEDILIESRILAVADVVESMASHRPYRPSLGVDSAVAEIRSHRGTRYDAAVVDALVAMIDQEAYELPQ